MARSDCDGPERLRVAGHDETKSGGTRSAKVKGARMVDDRHRVIADRMRLRGP